MADDIRVSGANELAAISRRLRDAGNRTLRLELLRGLRAGAKPLVEEAQKAAAERLPKRGGLAEFVAAGDIKVQVSTTDRNPRVRLRPRRGSSADRGRLRHPVFGDRNRWVTQTVKPGWFTATLEQNADIVRRELVTVIEDVARKIEGR